MKQMTAGMSAEDRQALRTEIEDELVAEARDRAKAVYRSSACVLANRMERDGRATSKQVELEHAKCQGEIAGNGCLDECHDKAPGEGG